MNRVRRAQLAIDAIEDIQLVALRVKDNELRRIEKAPFFQAVALNEVPPVLAAITQVHRSGRRPKRAIRSRDTSGRMRDPLPRPRRNLNHKTRLAAKLCR